MIRAEDARNNAKKTSDFLTILNTVSNEIEKASKEGKFRLIVRVKNEFKHALIKEFIKYGYDVEKVYKEIFPTDEIEIKW